MEAQQEPPNLKDGSGSDDSLRCPSTPNTASATDSPNSDPVRPSRNEVRGEACRPQCGSQGQDSSGQDSSQEEGGPDSSQEDGGITGSGGNGSGDNGSGDNAQRGTKSSSKGTTSTNRSNLTLVTPFCPLDKDKTVEQAEPKPAQSPSHRVVLRPLPPGFAAQHIHGHGVNGAWPDPSNSVSDAATKNQFMQNWAESVDRSNEAEFNSPGNCSD